VSSYESLEVVARVTVISNCSSRPRRWQRRRWGDVALGAGLFARSCGRKGVSHPGSVILKRRFMQKGHTVPSPRKSGIPQHVNIRKWRACQVTIE
jgi:hypothetical protein